MSISQTDQEKIDKCWADHIEAHNGVDKKLMAATYTNDCYITQYNVATKVRTEFRGIKGKKQFAEEHLDSLMNYDGKPTTDMKVSNHFYGNTLYNQWNIKSDNYCYKDGADTFIFGGPDMLITHHYQWYFGTKFTKSFESTDACFEAHHGFVVTGDVLGVVDTFTEDCMVSFFNTRTNSRQEFIGREQVKVLYTSFLKLLEGVEVEGEENSTSEEEGKGALFFAYKAPSVGIKKANDVFVFGTAEEGNKISKLWTTFDGPDIEVGPFV